MFLSRRTFSSIWGTFLGEADGWFGDHTLSSKAVSEQIRVALRSPRGHVCLPLPGTPSGAARGTVATAHAGLPRLHTPCLGHLPGR